MKLSTIIRAIVAPVVQVQSYDDAISIWLFGDNGPGVTICDTDPGYGYPPRAKPARFGGLHVRYWGRDTFVHQNPEAP